MNQYIRKRPLLAALVLGLILSLAGALADVGAVHAADDPTVSQFLSTFQAARGTVQMSGDELVYTLGGENSYVQVSTEGYASGSQWYVEYLTVRNTVALRLKNQTGAESAELWFKTRTKDWSSERKVTFDLETDGEYHMYLINLSENAGATGVLTGLRLVPKASAGTLSLDHISFERESEVYDYAGEIISCTADGYSVTVRGTLGSAYSGQTVSLYRTDVSNMLESLDGLEPVAEVKATGTDFTLQIPYHDGEVTMLSSSFLAAVNGVKVGRMFSVENWRDFSENPYEFELPSLTVSAADYGAAGDSFTDDTAAIQSAIDDVSRRGGGTVVVEGDPELPYGRRYVVTSVWMKDNVELCIEEGAVLWQSWRESDYFYPVYKGHDMEGITWGHNGLAMNYPLIYGNQADNIKITGGGTIRLLDVGSTSRTNMYSGNYSACCRSLIHLVPIGLYNSTNVEVSDIKILRTNCYHMVVYSCENVYIGNVTMTEDNCLSGDGISIGAGSKNVVIDRCMLYTNDDAIVLVAQSIAEPRGVTWWKAKPDGGDNRLQNITLRHSAVTPGNIIVLITWGVDASDLTWQTISGIEIYDNILGANLYNSACMNLCPGQGDPYGAVGKSVPVYHVRMFDNSYRGTVSNLSAMVKHDWIVDSDGVDVVSSFVDPDFEQKLAYWEYSGEYLEDVSSSAGAAVLSGAGSGVWQGLELAAGSHTFRASIRTENGASARLFAKDGLTGEILAEETVQAADGASAVLSFELPARGVCLLGAENTAEGTVYFSSPSISTSARSDAWFAEDFEGDSLRLRARGWNFSTWESTGVLAMEDGMFGKLELLESYGDFDFKCDFMVQENNVSKSGAGGISLEFRRSDSGCYRVRYDAAAGALLLERDKDELTVLAQAELKLKNQAWYQLGLRVTGGSIEVYLDGERVMSAQDEAPLRAGEASLSCLYLKTQADNLEMAAVNTLSFARSANWSEGQGEEEQPPRTDEPGCGGRGSAQGAWFALLCAFACIFAVRRRP